MAPKKPAAAKPQPQTSKRGAKPLPKADIVGDQSDDGALAVRHGELVAMSAEHRQVLDTFGDGLPYVRELYVAESQRDMRTAAEAGVRIGRRLIVIKEHEPHGEWLSCLAQIGVGPDTAQRMMAAARRLESLPNTAAPRHLLDAAKTQGRLFELLSLPEDQFKELAIDGQTGGLALDDIEQMTFRELRDAVRDARADLEAKDQRINKLSEDVNKAEEKAVKAARKWKGASPDEQQVTLEQRAVAAKHELLANLGNEKSGLTLAFIDLADHCNKHDLDCSQFMGDLIGELLVAVRTLRDDYEFGFAVPVVNDQGA